MRRLRSGREQLVEEVAVSHCVLLYHPPLSQIGRSIYPLNNMHVTAFWHIVLVGIPTAFFVSRGLGRLRTALPTPIWSAS